ncbi:transcriptional regulator [Klebsiella michiganensis]|nr:transcriptional regulator [Klebsiella michiganensis]
MSPSPSVISRFSTYYATLDTQPPSALAALYHTNALLIDPFGQHQGLSAIQGYLSHLLANVRSLPVSPSMPRSAKVNVLPSPGPCTGRIRDLPGVRRYSLRAARWSPLKTNELFTSVTTTTPGRCCTNTFPCWAGRCAALNGGCGHDDGAHHPAPAPALAPGSPGPSLRTATGLSPAAAIRRVCRRYSSTVPTSASALSI